MDKAHLQTTIPFRLTADITVRQLLDRFPQSLGVFLRQRLLCAGCPAEAFHTLADVAREYGLDEAQFIAGLQAAIDRQKSNTGLVSDS